MINVSIAFQESDASILMFPPDETLNLLLKTEKQRWNYLKILLQFFPTKFLTENAFEPKKY